MKQLVIKNQPSKQFPGSIEMCGSQIEHGNLDQFQERDQIHHVKQHHSIRAIKSRVTQQHNKSPTFYATDWPE